MKHAVRLRSFLALAGSSLLAVSSAHAADGTWTRTTGAFNWSDAASWSGGTIADGSGFTASFTAGFTGVNTSTATVTLDTSRSIGHIIKDDTDATLNAFIIASSGGSILTLATGGGAPTITNSDLGGGGRMDITAQLSGTQGLTKLGVGNVHLNNNANAWSGNTTVTAGLLHLGGASLANIGGGSGRNISVAAGTAIGINGLTNAGLNRIVETAAEISVLTGSGNNAVDFTSATGANLPGAFYGSNLTNGGKTEIQGIITMANNYRLGAVGGYQNGAFGIMQASLLSGTNGLIVGGNRVVIVGTHTFSGDTTIRDGGVLGLSGLNADAVGVRNNSSALQNSVLDLGGLAATGRIFLEAGTSNGISGLTTSANLGTKSATFGGLKGSRDLVSTFSVGNVGNNTTGQALANITGFTLNTGTGVEATYSGAIGGFGAGAVGANGGDSTLTKTGDGTQILSGVHTYTGATNINGGTLVINGSTSTSIVTVGASGTLGGNGTIGGVTTINGTLAVGNSPGQMNFSDTLGLAGTAIMEIDGNAGAGLTGGHDFVNLTGAGAAGVLTYGGAMTLDIGTIFGGGAYSWNLFDMASETGTFTSITLADQYFGSLLDDDLNGIWDLTSGINTWQFTESTGALSLTVVPEPRAALLGALGMLALLRRRR